MTKTWWCAAAAIALAACTGEDGSDGARGDDGTAGERGEDGAEGADGRDGVDGLGGVDGLDGARGLQGIRGRAGLDGEDGDDGRDGLPGEDGAPGADGEDALAEAPRSSMVAISLDDDLGTGARTIPTLVTALVDEYARGTMGPIQFPLAPAATDTVRAIAGLHGNVVVSWLDPLTFDDDIDAPRFGANPDYIAFFGDGWDDGSGRPPQWNGRDGSGWVWVSHEYISNLSPTAATAPTGQHALYAHFLRSAGLLDNDVDAQLWAPEDLTTYGRHYKTEVGGSWFRVVQDPASGEWSIDRGANAVRYDATSGTRLLLEGHSMSAPDHDDDGVALPDGVVAGIVGDCSGAQTPWGTILTAEENVQDFYGDLESCWTSGQKFVAGQGFDPGANIAPIVTPSLSAEFGRTPDPNGLHTRDVYGFLAEIDPGVAPAEYSGSVADGVGHRKLGYLGRARWENATFAVGTDAALVPGQPIVLYAGNDRRSGHIFKWVTREAYTAGMSRAETRALLDDGTLHVAHFAGLDDTNGYTLVGGVLPTEDAPGTGRWIELSVDSDDVAPNAVALGRTGLTVGEALRDVSYNGIGGFPDDDAVRSALFTACLKVGVMELNRPEDIEWNANDPSGTPRLYVAFTKNDRQVALDQDGVLYPVDTHDADAPLRRDPTGSIFAMQESLPSQPGSSEEFDYWMAWQGRQGRGDFDAGNPDNIAIDRNGGVWFGTDGNFGLNGHADAIYYLDLDASHAAGAPGIVTATRGLAFRVVATPSDAEATGPAFSSGMGTLFFDVQHPGEEVFSRWPGR